MDHRIFISYSRADSDFVRRLIGDLINQGLNVWLDQRDIAAGQRWDRVIEQALQECDTFVVVLTPNSVASENVLDEISYAINANKRVIPILHRDCEIPYRVARVQFVDFRGDYMSAVQHLVAEIRNLPHSQPVKTKKKRTGLIVLGVLLACIASVIFLVGAYSVYMKWKVPTLHPLRTELPVTEQPVTESPFIPAEINPNLPPPAGNYIELDAWFLNDPQLIFFQSGGPVNLSYLTDTRTGNPCSGFAGEAPNVIVNMTGDSAGLTLKFLYKTNDDAYATLLIELPAGAFFCPAASNEPEWTFDEAPYGEYKIWIGTFGNNSQDGTLYITHDTFFYP